VDFRKVVVVVGAGEVVVVIVCGIETVVATLLAAVAMFVILFRTTRVVRGRSVVKNTGEVLKLVEVMVVASVGRRDGRVFLFLTAATLI
jgi:hypothetical protein